MGLVYRKDLSMVMQRHAMVYVYLMFYLLVQAPIAYKISALENRAYITKVKDEKKQKFINKLLNVS